MSSMAFSSFYSSDYGSGNSSPLLPLRSMEKTVERPRSFAGKTQTLEDVMKEFKYNGLDSPYETDDDLLNRYSGHLSGMGPSSGYLRQKSWPEPERTPAAPLPRAPAAPAAPAPALERPGTADEWPPVDMWGNSFAAPTTGGSCITSEQLRVLQTLPDVVLYRLLRDLQQSRERRLRKKRLPDECRFCKNNGEREGFYRSHVLKDESGRVTCPVLRAFVCKRCGASGPRAHTIKYCPLSTDQERIQSSAMMRSVRMASGRKRTTSGTAPSTEYFVNDFVNEENLLTAENYDKQHLDSVWPPLDPVWAALEKKLMM